MEDFRTKGEIEKDNERKKLCEMYKKYRQDYPELSRNRIIMKVAFKTGWTIPGVKNVLVANNLYKVGRRK